MSLKKAEVLMRDLKEKLALRFPSTYAISSSVDSSGNPVLTIDESGAWATTEQYIVIRIRPRSSLGTNSLGMAQESFGPHEIQIISENDAADKSFLTDEHIAILMFEASRVGSAIEWYLQPTTEKPVLAGMISANLLKRLDDLRFPLIATA